MPICVRPVFQPDGTTLMAMDPTVKDLSTCTYVIEDRKDSNAWRELGDLNLEQASVIAGAVGLLWAIAWGFKTIAKAIPSEPNESE